MRALLLLALLPALAVAQGLPPRGNSTGGGGGTACALSSSAQAFASYFRSTNVSGTQTGFQCDGINPQCFDPGPGARNGIGTNAAGEILLGPGSGTGTVVRSFGTYIGLDFQGQNLAASNALTAGAVLELGTSGFIRKTTGGAVPVTDPDGLQINSTTAIKGWVQVPVTVDVGPINNNACVTQSVTVAGAALNDGASANADFALPLGVILPAGNTRVTAANTVEMTLCNITTGGALDPASGSFIFRLSR